MSKIRQALTALAQTAPFLIFAIVLWHVSPNGY
jgi:hypothetical protein